MTAQTKKNLAKVGTPAALIGALLTFGVQAVVGDIHQVVQQTPIIEYRVERLEENQAVLIETVKSLNEALNSLENSQNRLADALLQIESHLTRVEEEMNDGSR